MKTRIAMIAAIAMMTIQFTIAGEPAKKFVTEEQKIAYATKNLLVALHSSNSGLIESALRITAQMKMRYPSTDVSALVNIMNELWHKNPSGTTRYKAYVAASICENPEWYSSEKNIVIADDENFFKAASTRLQEDLLSANTK